MNPYAIPGLSDPISSATHLLGAVVFLIAGMIMLTRLSKDWARFGSIAFFLATVVYLLTMSGIYHMSDRGGMFRTFFERLDHLGIFLLIAGTFTPAITILFSGTTRLLLLTKIWLFTAAAISYRFNYFDSISHTHGAILYLAIGWTGVVPAYLMWRRHGWDFILPLVVGALIYSIGAVMEAVGEPNLWPGIVGAHEQFHVAVLFGIAFHFYFIWTIADGSAFRLSSRHRATSQPSVVPESMPPAPMSLAASDRQPDEKRFSKAG